MQPTARVIELFTSIQGEGLYVGLPHLFVRFWDCNLSCHYCDTDVRGAYQEYSRQQLLEAVRNIILTEGSHHAVSLTGGEPLLWWKFLKEWLPDLKGLGQRTYLETNGALPQLLSEILPWIDIIAMDIKPPSATADRPLWREHETFLQLATKADREIFVKIVVTKETREEELCQAYDLMAKVDTSIPLVLQPVTPWGPVQDRPSQEQLERWRRKASCALANVRVIPQMHRLLGVR